MTVRRTASAIGGPECVCAKTGPAPTPPAPSNKEPTAMATVPWTCSTATPSATDVSANLVASLRIAAALDSAKVTRSATGESVGVLMDLDQAVRAGATVVWTPVRGMKDAEKKAACMFV